MSFGSWGAFLTRLAGCVFKSNHCRPLVIIYIRRHADIRHGGLETHAMILDNLEHFSRALWPYQKTIDCIEKHTRIMTGRNTITYSILHDCVSGPRPDLTCYQHAFSNRFTRKSRNARNAAGRCRREGYSALMANSGIDHSGNKATSLPSAI